ncbi:MAG: hypothetical protein RJB65_2429 [Actinomycetota bacterium]|jgi:hypothetical protein
MIRTALRQSLARWIVFIGIGLEVTLVLTRPNDDWRYELARATDASGLYLLLLLPLWTGVAAWDAQQAHSHLAPLLPSLPHRGRSVLFASVGVAGWAVALHLAVLATTLAIATASDGIGTPLILLPITQCAIIVGFVSAGASIGWRFPSPLVGPSVAGGLLLANVLATSVTHVRRLTGLGEGGYDFNGLVPGRLGLLAQAGCGALLALTVALGALSPRSWARRCRFLAGVGAVASAWLVLFVITPTTSATASSLNSHCSSGEPVVCLPLQYRGSLKDISASVVSVVSTLEEMGGTAPTRIVFDGVGNSFPPGVGIIGLSPSIVRQTGLLHDSAIAAITHPFSCDLAAAPDPLHFAIYEAVSYLVHERRGTRPPSGLPLDLATDIASLPDTERTAWLQMTTRQMWSCRLDELALPPGVALPGWLVPAEAP